MLLTETSVAVSLPVGTGGTRKPLNLGIREIGRRLLELEGVGMGTRMLGTLCSLPWRRGLPGDDPTGRTLVVVPGDSDSTLLGESGLSVKAGPLGH